jgi:hypothetical protein
MFGPDFDEDLPAAGVAVLANGLAASGSAVLVHSVFTERGDVFDPRVIADTGPLTMADLLTILTRPDAPAAPPHRPPSEPPPTPRREPLNEPPPTAWTAPGPMPARPVPNARPQPQAAPAEEPPPVPDSDPDDLPEYGPPEDDLAEYEEEEEDVQDVPALAGEQGPAERPESVTPPANEHEHRHTAETRAEPQGLAEWMWKETAPEPDHYSGPPPDADHYAAMPPGPGGQGGPAPAQGPAGSRRRGTIVLTAAAVFVLLAGLTAAAVLTVGPGKSTERHEAATTPSPASPAPASPGAASQVPTSTPTAVRPAEEYRPTGVRIVDSRVSIEVSWKDGSGGQAAYYVVGGPVGRTPTTLANTKPGATKVVVAALNPSVEYCLTVVAVVDVDRVAHARPVCTHRGKRKD